MSSKTRQKIFISAAEVSGDRHCGRLIEKMKTQSPGITCEGLGGPAMAQAGCQLLEDLTVRSAMLTNALGQIGFYYRLLARIKKHFAINRPDLVVLADSPAWNFHIAKAAKKLDIPVLYYIAPQLWAWGSWRCDKLRRLTDNVACILPFEQQWFRDRDINATYVGHPLFDHEMPPESQPHWMSSPKSSFFPTIALLPGSRQHEIDRLWRPMQRIAQRIKKTYPAARFVTTTPNEESAEKLKKQTNTALPIETRSDSSIEAVTRHADLALVASGTATLEVAAQHCPMIVLYHVNQLQWQLIGKWLVKTKYISLVNILAGTELVPEFVPFANRIDAVVNQALEILDNDEKRRQTSISLKQLTDPIVQPGASARVIQMIKHMLRDSHPGS
jgi:lipid-A-disaccharide synthase